MISDRDIRKALDDAAYGAAPLVSLARQALDRQRKARAREAPRLSLVEFAREAWPILHPGQPYVDNWHIHEIGAALEQVSAGLIPKLAINIPPGSMKSLLVSVFWPAWEWTTRPWESYIACSHDHQLANRDNRRMRQVINSPWYQERWGAVFDWAGDQRQKGYFENTSRGFRISMSPTSGATGHRATRIVIDDALSAKRAYSAAYRFATNQFIGEELYNRVVNETDHRDEETGELVPASARVFIGQRLHDNDPFGMIERGELGDDWEWIVLETEFDPAHSGRTTVFVDPRQAKGELLFKSRFNDETIRTAKVVLGSVGYSAQHQQRPTVPEGRIFKRSRWRRYQWLPRKIDQWLISVDCDFAGDKKSIEESDSVTAIGVFARAGQDVYIVDIALGIWETAELVDQLIRLREIYHEATALVIENKAAGPAVIRTLRKKVPGVIPFDPKAYGDKTSRAWSIQPYHEAGNFWLPDDKVDPHGRRWGQLNPASTDWIEAYLDELARFEPGVSANTDQVDITSQAVIKLLGTAAQQLRTTTAGLK